MIYSRLKLEETDYPIYDNAVKFGVNDVPCEDILRIYKTYCDYKGFESVMPLFNEEFTNGVNDVIGYYDGDKLVAFSLLCKYNDDHVEAFQFAWDYENPKLRLGIKSIWHETAYYKSLGCKYYYLGDNAEYKRQFDGYEELGRLP